MHWRRSLALALSTGAALAVAAPAARATVDTTLAFGPGSVHVVDAGPTANTVRFTMTVTNPATTRLFIDIKGRGEGYITLGSQAALGVQHAVYNQVSTANCQVYTGTTFGEADAVASADPNTLIFDIRKDELAPVIAVLMEDSAGGAPDCKGFDGVSNGRPISFADAGQTITPLDWLAPANATNLRAIGGARSITLFWTPPADALGVRYQVVEDGNPIPVSESVTGNAATFSNLVPGSVHTYHLRAYRFWGERLFAPAFTPGATAVATEFAPPATATGSVGSTVTQTVKGTTKKSTKKAARAFALNGFRVRSSRGRVRVTLPKLGRGQKIEIQRSAASKKAKFSRIATSKARTYVDRKVRLGRTYRYRLILVAKDGSRSLPSGTLTVRVR